MPGMRLVCRSAHGHFPRKGQRRRSLTVWKAETSGADCLGAPGLRTVPSGLRFGARTLDSSPSLECTHPTSTQSSPQLTLPSSASSVSSRGMMLIASPFPT
ncbi:uncharacterized protein [Symphalangus syndactylus]|uniref:uncharacterized protein isoform X6 n=1 Tax=Symphalangus syndactylus TaxID=9590 RepID=UPI00300489BF